jgi:hypothetical protein
MAQVPQWEKLWKRLRDVYVLAGKDRHVAVLDNHSNRKEAICRKLGVVSDADISRIGRQIGVFPN